MGAARSRCVKPTPSPGITRVREQLSGVRSQFAISFLADMRAVEHVYVSREGNLCELVSEALPELGQEAVEQLLRIGALWYSAVPPLPPPHRQRFLSAETLDIILNARKQGEAAGLPKECFRGKALRAREDVRLNAGSYVRVHTLVKRFPAAQEVQWASRIIHNHESCIVVDKATGVQCIPSEDNVVDCLPVCIERALGLAEGELIPTHRLDEGTEGVVVIARTPAFASYFQTLLRKGGADAAAIAAAAAGAEVAASFSQPRLVQKIYKCVTRSPGPPLGMLRHDMVVGHRIKGSPKYTAALLQPFGEPEMKGTEAANINSYSDSTIATSLQHQTHTCILEVLSVEPLELGPEAAAAVMASSQAATSAAAASVAAGTLGSADAADADAHRVSQQHNTAGSPAEWDSPHGVGFCEARILLHTGRTHQIRAQMAAEGFPLVGDLLYGALHAMGALWQPPGASLASSPASVPGPTAAMSEMVDWRGILGEPGRSRVALQAWRLEVHDPGALEFTGSCPAVFTAGVPWWRT